MAPPIPNRFCIPKFSIPPTFLDPDSPNSCATLHPHSHIPPKRENKHCCTATATHTTNSNRYRAGQGWAWIKWVGRSGQQGASFSPSQNIHAYGLQVRSSTESPYAAREEPRDTRTPPNCLFVPFTEGRKDEYARVSRNKRRFKSSASAISPPCLGVSAATHIECMLCAAHNLREPVARHLQSSYLL